MVGERIWRNTAIALCALVPLSFYAVGDVTDAFPGVLTIQREESGPAANPPAQAEGYTRLEPEMPRGGEASSTSPQDAADLQRRMDSHASLPVVDGRLSFSVVDAGTGEVLAERAPHSATIPASTLKLLTASALLRVRDSEDVLVTRAVVSDGTITLVGEGDMTLTEDDLGHLARDAAALAQEQGSDRITLALDTSALAGGQNPAWGDNGTAGGWVAPTAALALDEGWLDGQQYGAKSEDPAGDAASRFAELLQEQGVTAVGPLQRGADVRAPEGAPAAEVSSAPLGEIIRRTLETSDNTTAELLAHLVAAARGEETTPAGAAAAVDAEIRELGAELGIAQEDLDALEIHDGSGLSRENRVPPALLSAVLGQVASGEVPALAQVLVDVPVAGLTGTLASRFEEPGTGDARGVVRGKTGYLGGAATLAGTTVLPDGRAVGFSIVVHGFDGADAAEAREAVDLVAAEIVRES